MLRFNAVALSFCHIEGGRGVPKSFHSLKGGGAQKVLPCLEGVGGAKSFGPSFSHFVAPPSP